MEFQGFPSWTVVSKLTTVQEVGLGTTTVRAFREQARFEATFLDLVERHLVANYVSHVCDR